MDELLPTKLNATPAGKNLSKTKLLIGRRVHILLQIHFNAIKGGGRENRSQLHFDAIIAICRLIAYNNRKFDLFDVF